MGHCYSPLETKALVIAIVSMIPILCGDKESLALRVIMFEVNNVELSTGVRMLRDAPAS